MPILSIEFICYNASPNPVVLDFWLREERENVSFCILTSFFFIFRIILLLFFLIQMPIWSIWWIAFVTMPAPTRSFWTFGYGRNKTAKMITSLTFVTTYKIVIWAWQIALVTLGPRILFWFWFWRWPMRIPADIWKKMSMRKQYWNLVVR